MRDLLTLIALGAGLMAGPAVAQDLITDPAPVIDFESDFDDQQTLEVLFENRIVDLLFSAPMPGFSGDAGFEGEVFVDFGVTFDFNTGLFSGEFFSIEDETGILVESSSLSDNPGFIFDLDPSFAVFEGDFRFDDLMGPEADAFGDFARVTIDSLDLIESGGDNVEFGAFTVVGLVESLSVDTGIAPIPLPAGLPLLAAGLGAIALLRSRRAA